MLPCQEDDHVIYISFDMSFWSCCNLLQLVETLPDPTCPFEGRFLSFFLVLSIFLLLFLCFQCLSLFLLFFLRF